MAEEHDYELHLAYIARDRQRWAHGGDNHRATQDCRDCRAIYERTDQP